MKPQFTGVEYLRRYDEALRTLHEQRASNQAQEAVHPSNRLGEQAVHTTRCNRCFGPMGQCEHDLDTQTYQETGVLS